MNYRNLLLACVLRMYFHLRWKLRMLGNGDYKYPKVVPHHIGLLLLGFVLSVSPANAQNLGGAIRTEFPEDDQEDFMYTGLAQVNCTQDEVVFPSPSCTEGIFFWENSIWWSGNNVNATYRMRGSGLEELRISLPDSFHLGPRTIEILDFHTWDGYLNRGNTGEQLYEQLRLAFYRDGDLVFASDFTPDLADEVCYAEWNGNMGTFLAPEGVDEVVIFHAEYYENLASANSIVPVSLCLDYSPIDGAGGSSEVLPVEWLDISASYLDGQARIQWATASEANSSHFIIQRSEDGISYRSIGQAEGAGNALAISTYEFWDAEASHLQLPRLYYRLKQVDFDGSSSYSTTVSLEAGLLVSQGWEGHLYPNPFEDILTLSWPQGQSPRKLELFSFTGNVLRVFSDVQHDTQTRLNLESLPVGTYILRIKTDSGVFLHKIMKHE